MLGTVINHYSGVRPITYTLALCQNRVPMPIFVITPAKKVTGTDRDGLRDRPVRRTGWLEGQARVVKGTG